MIESKPVELNLSNLRYVWERISHLPAFIFYGTLLGYQREKSVIVGDDDIDIFVDRRHRSEIDQIFAGTELKIRRQQRKFKTEFFAQGLRDVDGVRGFVDFYFYEDQADVDYVIDNWNFKAEYRNSETNLHVPKSMIFPIKAGAMQGINMMVPNDTEACCEFLYGEGWRTPLSKQLDYETVIEDNKPKIITRERK